MAKKASANPELDEIIQRPENRSCADCGAKAPRWASVNLGVFFCLDCSGAHRNLGTHITVVKSVTLDKWNPKWIDVMKKVGNRVGNEYYERELRSGKLTEGSTLEKRASWIRQKYEKKEWCKRGQLSPSELLAQGRNPDANAGGGGNDRSASPDDRRRRDRDDDRRRDPRDDDRRRGDERRDDRRRDDRPAEQVRKPVPAPAAPKPAPIVDLFDLADNQPTVAAPAAAAPSSDWAAFPQQGAPQPQVAAVTQQFSNMQMAPGGAGLTDVFAPSATAQPAAQAHMLPQQQQPANSQDQKVDFMKNALASLYQQPAQPADPFAAAFSATAPSNMGMGGQMCGAPAMMQQGYGGMAAQGYGGYGQPQQQMPIAPQQGMGGMGGMMQQGVQQGMQQPAMMQQANGYQGGMANGMQMGMQSGMGMSMPSGMPAGMPAGAGMSMPSGMPGMGMSMPSGAPVPQQQAALPGTHADAMKHVLDGFSLGGNQAHSSTSTSGLPSPGSVSIPPAPSSLDIDAFSAFGQTASQPQQPSGMAAAGMPMQQPMMGGQMGGMMQQGMQQPMMGGMQPQQQMGMQQQPMMQQQMGGMQQQGGGMQQQMGGMPQLGMQQQMMGGAPQQVW